MEDIINQDPQTVEVAVEEVKTVPEKQVEQHEEGQEQREEHEDGVDDGKPKKKTGSQRAREAAQRERERAAKLEGENEALRRQLGITKSEPKTEPRSGEPRIEDFEDYGTYTKALTRWEVQEQIAANTKKTEQTQSSQSWEQKKQLARSKYDDFDDVLDSAAQLPMSEVMSQALLGSEVGGDIAYHLASHHEEARKIAGLPPYEAAKALAKIEAAYSVEQKTKTTGAPRPPVPVQATPTMPVKDTDGMMVY